MTDSNGSKASGHADKALVVIDMQLDFLAPESPLCVKGGLACLPQVQQAVQLAREHSLPVFWVVREHHPSGAWVVLLRVRAAQSSAVRCSACCAACVGNPER